VARDARGRPGYFRARGRVCLELRCSPSSSHTSARIRSAAKDALEGGWLGIGSYVQQFEQELTSFLELPESRRLVAVNTGTSALHLALKVAGVDPGDEVIAPALNNIGDFQAIADIAGIRSFFTK
jgi:dTDP-4-amino-4,6-dideoxygalactose transaminase